MSRSRRLPPSLGTVAWLPVILLTIGTVGYRLVEGWPWFDAMYMTVITLTTVGYGETHPLSPQGRVFTMFLALGGIFMLFYAATEAIRTVVSGELQTLLGRRRMEKKIAALKGHVVVCGYGRMGEQVCQEFSKAGVPFVIVDRNAAVLENLALPHAHPLVGDATSDDVLRSAGLERARALVATAASDADNVFITMTARLLNDKVPIVARAEEDSTVPKLRRAGATRVVSPYVLGGGRVAQAVLRPAVLDFLEVTTRKEHMDLQIEEVAIAKASALDGQTIHESRLRSEVGLIVVAIKRRDGHMTFNPAEDVSLGAGDTLIMLGRPEQLLTVDRLASAR